MIQKTSDLDKIFRRTGIRCDQVCVAGHAVGPRYRHQCREYLAKVAAEASRVVRRIMTPEERRERQRENGRRWREKNPEWLKTLGLRWRAENRDRKRTEEKR